MSSRRDSVGSCTSSAAHSMTLSVPATAVASRRSSFNVPLFDVIAHDDVNRLDLLPPHCHEMLSEDSEGFVEGDAVEQPPPIITGRKSPAPDSTPGPSSRSSSQETSPAHVKKTTERSKIAEKRAEHAKIASRARARSFCAPETEAEAGSALKATVLHGHEGFSTSKGRWNSVEGSFFLTVPFSDTATDPVVLMQRAASPPGIAPSEQDECPTAIPAGFSKHWVKTYKQFAAGKSKIFTDTSKLKSSENYARSLDKLRAWSNQIELDRRRNSTFIQGSSGQADFHRRYFDGVLQPPSGKKDFHEKCNPCRNSHSKQNQHATSSRRSQLQSDANDTERHVKQAVNRLHQHRTSSSSSNTFDGWVSARRRKISQELSPSAQLQLAQTATSYTRKDFWPPWWNEQWGVSADFEIGCWKKTRPRPEHQHQSQNQSEWRTLEEDIKAETDAGFVYQKCRNWLRKNFVGLRRMSSTDRSMSDF